MTLKHMVNLAKRKQDPGGKEVVTHIGGRLDNGIEWLVSHDEAVENIRSGRSEYFISLKDGSGIEKLIIGTSIYGDTFIKSELDRYEPLRLLKLPADL